MTGGGPRILLSAGEPSGDLHAAALVGALRDRLPGARLTGFGGPRMVAAGVDVRWRMEPYTALGLVEVVGKIPAHLGLLRAMRRAFRAGEFDLAILVDYPGFHLRVGEAARQAGVPVLQYIAPQLWAWRPGRARRWRRAADALAVILPFEEAFFRGVGMTAQFVGHPLAEAIRPGRTEARQALGVGAEERVLALFPGSRKGELGRLWPVFRAAATTLLRSGHCDRVLVAGTGTGDYPDPGPCEVLRQDSPLVMAAADAGLAKSGTTTLEAALAGMPMVVAYRVHPLTGWLARRMLRVQRIGLVNLVAGADVVPELLQDEVTPEALVAAAEPLLDPASAAARAQRAGLEVVRSRLGGVGAAEAVAAIGAGLLSR